MRDLLNRFLFCIVLVTLLCSGCSPVYVLRAGIEEAKILSRRRPIADVLEDPRTDARTRARLNLVLQARSFARHELGLRTGESFTTYSWVDSDTLLMVLSAARKDRFQQYTWWFPIVGRVPYKGYFDFAEADRAAAELEKQGYDAYVRPSSAFSTLGWFNDPLLNTVLRYGEVSLAATVIHELVHNTIYVPSQVAFNESFANFVGDRGAAVFLCARDGEASQNCTLARNAWADNLVFGEFLSRLIADLEQLYARPGLSAQDRIRLREDVFNAARQRFETEVRPRLLTSSFRRFTEEPLNNATLIATRLYYDRLDLFERAFIQHGQDLKATIDWILRVVREGDGDAFERLERSLK
jgi:predicted aminopeptidase